MPNILSKIFSTATSAVVDSVGNAFDKNFTSKEEKEVAKLALQQEINKHLEAVEAEATKKLELELADIADARNREIQIVTSDKAPLINKIIQPLLAILVLGSCFLFWYMMIFKDIPKEKETLMAGITGSLTTLSMGIIGYYFGSSTGSAAKQKQLDTMMNK